jgi:hypothetical protein
MQIVDDCPWKRVLEIWPDPLTGLADASILAVATTNRYDAVATFDRKLARKLERFGLSVLVTPLPTAAPPIPRASRPLRTLTGHHSESHSRDLPSKREKVQAMRAPFLLSIPLSLAPETMLDP